MPELPDLEAARRLTQRVAAGKRIVQAVVAEDDKVVAGVAPGELQAALVGRTLVAAKRRGKQLWYEFDEGPSLLLHFGMTGGVVVRGEAAAQYRSSAATQGDGAAWPPRFCKLELAFDDGTRLAFYDARRFGRLRFLADAERVPPISELGWDPLLDMPPLPAFAAALAAQRRAAKVLLLDQSFSAGVGNWIADEVLYQARVHPEQPAHSIPADKVAALHSAIRDVCQVACEADADSERFPPGWLFHRRWGKGSGEVSRLGGHAIHHITVGGRTSAFVPALQRLDKAAAAAAAAGKPAKPGGGKRAGGSTSNAGGDEPPEAQREDGPAAPVTAPPVQQPAGKRGRGKAAGAATPAPPAAMAPHGGKTFRASRRAAAGQEAAAPQGAAGRRKRKAAVDPAPEAAAGAVTTRARSRRA